MIRQTQHYTYNKNFSTFQEKVNNTHTEIEGKFQLLFQFSTLTIMIYLIETHQIPYD